MGAREYDYIRGNTALAPERKVKEQGKRVEKQRRESERKAYEQRKRTILNTMGMATVLFVLGSTALFVNSQVHDVQKQLLILEEGIKDAEDINAAINVEMLRFASFDKIKTTAENELGMVYPNSESTISIDMSKEYFSHLKPEEDKNSKLLEKLIASFK